jgi:hypothetical protein
MVPDYSKERNGTMTKVTMSVSVTEHTKAHTSRDEMVDLVWSGIGSETALHQWADKMARSHPNAIQFPEHEEGPGFYDNDTNNVLFRAFLRRALQAWLDYDLEVLESMDICRLNRQ